MLCFFFLKKRRYFFTSERRKDCHAKIDETKVKLTQIEVLLKKKLYYDVISRDILEKKKFVRLK